MIVHPTVVIGVGSTGKSVVANAQKYLYEVLNGEELQLFKFIVLESSLNQLDPDALAAGARQKPIDINIDDLGSAYFTLKSNLGDDFNWCKYGMHKTVSGAGNMRAAGRLMLFHHMEAVREIIQNALNEVNAAALDNRTTRQINQLLRERGGNEQLYPIPNTPVPVVFVVGTLAGGTCSGTCVDLAYLLRRIAPMSQREAMFFIPAGSPNETFKANSWAALSDLVYFTEHPEDYKAMWLNKALAPISYDEGAQPGPVPPFKHIYLITQRDRAGSAHLPYSDLPSSPLLMMGGLTIAANLLGLYEIRQSRLVDLNTRVGSDSVFNTFLTSSIRGVSFPKYEMSEAAACKIIAEHICEYWLSAQACYVQGRREELQQEEINKAGKLFWNGSCPSIWAGLRGNVDLASLAKRIRSDQIADVSEYLKAQVTENRDGTIFRAIDQNVENRYRALQHAIRTAFVESLQQKQNLQYAEWLLDGVQAEVERARKYWEALGIPPGENDMPAWQTKAGELSRRLVDRYTSLSANSVAQRLDVIEDELDQIVVRLEMFLMHRTLGNIGRWIETELEALIDSIRQILIEVRTYSASTADSIDKSLEDRSGPLLKVSRAASGGFSEEIASLAKLLPALSGKDYIDYVDGNYEGMLCHARQAGGGGKEHLFQELIERIQPALIQQLQKGGSIDIVSEIEHQQVVPQVVMRARTTQLLSLSTRHDLMTGEDNVPSVLLTKSVQSSNRLEQVLRKADPGFPTLRKDELPLFDHMALFYQEGGKFNLKSLLEGAELEKAFAQRRADDEEVIDPLRLLTKNVKAAEVPSKDKSGVDPDASLRSES